ILSNLSIAYDDQARTVTTTLFGLSPTTASFQEGVGCALDFSGSDRPHISTSSDLPDAQALWPAGDLTGAPDPSLQSTLEAMLAADNDAGLNTRALLVVKQGAIVAEAYGQGATTDTPLLGWSMAKSLTSVMLGNLEYRGLLDIGEPPGFEVWQDDDRRDITVRDLLTMTDGLGFAEAYDPGDDATAMLFTEPSAANYVLQQPLEHRPGTVFNYSSGTANLLAYLHYLRTGADPASAHRDFLDHIYRPLGMQNAVFETDASGVFVGSSYFYAPARDWARLGQLMLNNGEINGRRIVREDWVARSVTPNTSGNEKAYGFQWWLNRGDEGLRWPSLPADAFAAQGNRQQWLMVIPSEQLAIVRLGWTAGSYPADSRFADLVSAARDL
ncbi:MAG: hypothetical protein RLZZ385_1281, partial [Pseudomonadota bacterium]